MIDVTVNKAFVSPKFLEQRNITLPHTFRIPDDATGRDLIVELQLNPDTPTIFVVNDAVVPLSQPLHQNDQVEILYPIGGG